MRKERKTAFRAALEAGKLILDRVGDKNKIDYKSPFNLVTDVDKLSEKLILEIIRSEFPDDEILAEESGSSKQKSNRLWLIDPIDGTTNFAHGYPFFCVSIGLVEDNERKLAVVLNPVADELFWAEKGGGAFMNDEEIHVSGIKSLDESLLATGFPPNTARAEQTNMEQFQRLTGLSHGVRRDGAAALDICFVACGRLDGFWERKLSPWDVAAASLIVEEAGGRVTDLSGNTFNLQEGHIIATNTHIHQEVVGALAEQLHEVGS